IEQFFGRSEPDCFQHFNALFRRVRNVAQNYSLSAFVKSSYSAAVSRLSTSPAFDIFIRIIQPVPYGSVLTVSGSSASDSFIDAMVPATGVKTSETAFTDSTEPNASFAANSSPAFGNSTYTTSPNEFWAYSVMPMMASLPSTLTHSWSLL